MGIILTLAAPDDWFLFFDADFHEVIFGIGATMLFVRGTNEGAVNDMRLLESSHEGAKDHGGDSNSIISTSAKIQSEGFGHLPYAQT